MTRMIVVYRTPDDPAAFEKHYFELHVPLAKRLPGLTSYEVSIGPAATLGSASDAYRVATLTFTSMDQMKASFASEVGRACAADRRILAPDEKVQIFLFDDRLV
jgi:uncharacterized protein (TIGR02118 family)